MTDEERQELCAQLKRRESTLCYCAADEIERLAALAQSDAEPVAWRSHVSELHDLALKKYESAMEIYSEDHETALLTVLDEVLSALDKISAPHRPDAQSHDSDGVTRKDVEGWMRYFDEHADEFVAAHEAIMRKAVHSNAEPLIKVLDMLRQKAHACDIEFKETYDPAAASAAYAYTEAAGELERLRERIKE